MANSNKKAKQRAKYRRKELRERIKSEQAAAKSNKAEKAEKAERNRRFAGQESQIALPEDDYLFFDTSPLLRKETNNIEAIGTLELLYHRQFFYRLNKELEKTSCDNEFTISRKLLQGMGMKSERIENILNILEENGGYCDCEVIYNILAICLKEREYDGFYEMY